MSPLEIDMMLHYYSRANDYREGDFSAPAVAKTIAYFTKEGLIAESPQRAAAKYFITERGRAYVEFLKAVPLPISKWVHPCT